MNKSFQKKMIQIQAIEYLKKLQILTPVTAQMVLNDPMALMQKLQEINEIKGMFQSPFEPPDETVNELIKFMVTENSIPVGFNPKNCHFLIAGQTGCGKTTQLNYIFAQILFFARHLAPFIAWLFVKAQDMRPLLKINKNIVIVKFDEIKLNPLEPPIGVQTKHWLSIIVDIFIQTFHLYDASKALLIECLSKLYERFARYNHYPNLFDLQNYVIALKFPGFSRTARYQESILNRLQGLLNGAISEVFNCSRGHINLLTNRHTIFEIQYLTSDQQVFLVNYLLSHLFNSKLANQSNIRHFVGIDDSNMIFDASYEKRPDLGLPIIHHLLTTVRKALITIFALTQTPHQIGASILSNAFAMIMFSLSNGKDIEFMQKCMGISDFEQRKFCYNIPPRSAIVKFSDRYQKPFLATVPEFNLGDEVIPNQLTALNNRRLISNFKIQPRFKPRCELQGKQEGQGCQPSTTNPNLPKNETEKKISDFLMAVNLHQYKKTLTEIYKLANLSAGTGSRIAKICEKRNLIKIIKVSFGRGRPRYPVLLPEGYSFLDIEEKKFYGKGAGHEHIVYQYLIKDHFSKFEATIELNRGDKFMDVGLMASEKLVAIEVAMSAKNEKNNIKKNILKAKANFVIVACKDRKVQGQVENIVSELSEEFCNKTKVCLVGDLLKSKPDELIDEVLDIEHVING